MRRTAVLLLLIAAASIVAVAQQSGAAAAPDFQTVLNRQINNLENELVPLAEAMPEDKFNYQTTKDTLTFAKQVRHTAATNYFYCSAILGEKPPVDLGPEELGPEMKTKAEMVKFLKDSFAYAKKAFGTIKADNAVTPIQVGPRQGTRLGLAFGTISHGNNHYGQMVQYLRLNGVVPPASRPR